MHDKRLLVCDDEPRFGRFVKNVAEDLGYTVCVTTGGHAFIDAYGSFNPTTIVLDMIMPGMDGNELVLWLIFDSWGRVAARKLYPDFARIRRPPLPNGAIRILPNG